MRDNLKFIGLIPFGFGMHLWNVALAFVLCAVINYLSKLF